MYYVVEVEYLIEGWLEKNKDLMNDNVIRLLVVLIDKYVVNLFVDCVDQDDEVGGMRSRVKKGLFRIVVQRYKEQLFSLMVQLYLMYLYFVRCILLNYKKKVKQFNGLLVLDQLRCNGVLEGIRIVRMGFFNWLVFVEFCQCYEVFVRDLLKGYLEGQVVVRLMLDKFGLDRLFYWVGLMKVFFWVGVLVELEEKRDVLILEIMV